MQKPEKKLTRQQAEARIDLLEDRMAILLVVCKQRLGDWNPWFREGLYEEEESLGEEIRSWPEYHTARQIIDNMTRKRLHELGNNRQQLKAGKGVRRLAGTGV